MMCSSSCARSNPARPLLGLLVWSLSIRRSAAATRSRARSRSATVYCRGPGRVRFPRDPFDALLARIAAVSFFAAAIWSAFASGVAVVLGFVVGGGILDLRLDLGDTRLT